MLSWGRPWGALHNPFFLRLNGESQAGQPVRHQVYPEDVDGQEGDRQQEKGGQKQGPDLRRVASYRVFDELADVIEDPTPFPHGGDDSGEVVIEQHHVRGLAGHVGADSSHGHADIGALEGRGVVHPIPGHGHELALILEGLNDLDLLLWGHAGIDADRFHLPLEVPQA